VSIFPLLIKSNAHERDYECAFILGIGSMDVNRLNLQHICHYIFLEFTGLSFSKDIVAYVLWQEELSLATFLRFSCNIYKDVFMLFRTFILSFYPLLNSTEPSGKF
jgi:hypothetical protein